MSIEFVKTPRDYEATIRRLGRAAFIREVCATVAALEAAKDRNGELALRINRMKTELADARGERQEMAIDLARAEGIISRIRATDNLELKKLEITSGNFEGGAVDLARGDGVIGHAGNVKAGKLRP